MFVVSINDNPKTNMKGTIKNFYVPDPRDVELFEEAIASVNEGKDRSDQVNSSKLIMSFIRDFIYKNHPKFKNK